MLQILGPSCWYRDNCITKLWAQSSYFLYLYMVFIQHCFQLEQHCFHLDIQFSCSSNISNWLSRIPTQSSLVIKNSFPSWVSCTLSRFNNYFDSTFTHCHLTTCHIVQIIINWPVKIHKSGCSRIQTELWWDLSYLKIITRKDVVYYITLSTSGTKC